MNADDLKTKIDALVAEAAPAVQKFAERLLTTVREAKDAGVPAHAIRALSYEAVDIVCQALAGASITITRLPDAPSIEEVGAALAHTEAQTTTKYARPIDDGEQ